MKFLYISTLVLFVALATAAPTADDSAGRETIKKAHEECQANPESHVDIDTAKKMTHDEKKNDEKIRKHSLCMNVKLGLQQENGDINKDKLRTHLETRMDDKDKVNKIVEECGTKGTGTAVEVALELDKCLGKHIKNRHHGHGHHKHDDDN